jgi:peptidoglycan LD-endopeptidase CwlK
MMPKLSTTSASRLAACHHDLQVIVNDVANTRRVQVIEGKRDQATQHAAFVGKKSKVDWPNSKHNVDGVKRHTSWAVDIAELDAAGQIDWKDKESFASFAYYVLATAKALLKQGKITHALRWGGDWDRDGYWKDETFLDMPHFELVDVADGE